MKKNEDLSDYFLDEVVLILRLNDFRFTKETINSKIIISDTLKQKLKQLCDENKSKRIRYNEYCVRNKSMNIYWSYDVMNLYFNLKF